LEAIVPRVELPPAMSFTLHVTAVEAPPVPVTLAVNACPAPVETVAEVGEIATTIPSVSETTADAAALLSALLSAVTVTVGSEGMAFGAVYKPLGEIVPALTVPPATPPANHVTFLFDVPVTNAEIAATGQAICSPLSAAISRSQVKDQLKDRLKWFPNSRASRWQPCKKS
jgi:hypothetical protein